MSRILCALSLCLALSACKKNAETPDPATEVAQATPVPTPVATPEPTPEPIDTTQDVIVLCYHRFEEKGGREMVSTPAEFETQMQALKDNGITVIPMTDFLAWRRGEKNIPAKSAVITLDDGWLTGYTAAWPILKKFGYPFTMFIYTDYVKGGPKSGGQSMTWEQLAEMRDAGVDIGSHTVTHSSLTAKKGKTDTEYAEWLKHEIGDSKEILERELGIQVKTIAYPYGQNNEAVRKAVKDAGYEAAFTVYGQRLPHGAEATSLGRYAIDSTNPKTFEQAASFAGSVAASSEGGGMKAGTNLQTQPADGATIQDAMPEIQVNLSPLGAVDPKSVSMRVSGFGLVPAAFDPQTKIVSYKVTEPLRSRDVSIIVSSTTGVKKTETRWSFKFDPVAQ